MVYICIYWMNIFCVCTCIHACKPVTGTWELKKIIQYLFFPDFKIFVFFLSTFSPNFPSPKIKETQERSDLLEFRVRRKSKVIFLIIFAKAIEGLLVGSASLHRIARDGIPSCHCYYQAHSGGTECCESPKLSFSISKFLLCLKGVGFGKYLLGFQPVWNWAEFIRFVLVIWTKFHPTHSKQCSALVIFIPVLILSVDSLSSFWLNQFKVKLANLLNKYLLSINRIH